MKAAADRLVSSKEIAGYHCQIMEKPALEIQRLRTRLEEKRSLWLYLAVAFTAGMMAAIIAPWLLRR